LSGLRKEDGEEGSEERDEGMRVSEERARRRGMKGMLRRWLRGMRGS
jgi:CRISPR/Cas system CMR-associated protein Cmr1 (group 7 of RAMP superfamily)